MIMELPAGANQDKKDIAMENLKYMMDNAHAIRCPGNQIWLNVSLKRYLKFAVNKIRIKLYVLSKTRMYIEKKKKNCIPVRFHKNLSYYFFTTK